MKVQYKIVTFFYFCCYFISLLIFAYVLLANTLHLLNISDLFIDPRLFDKDYLKLLISSALSIGALGTYTSYLLGDLKAVSFSKKERAALIISALFLSFFFVGNIYIKNISSQVVFLLVFIILSYFIPALASFYINFKFDAENYLMRIQNFKTKSIPLSISLITLSAINILLSGSLIVGIIGTYFNRGKFRQELLGNNLFIAKVTPTKTTYLEKITLVGYNFGWRLDPRYKIVSTKGEIRSNLWTNEAIDFIVPHYLQTGKVSIWIEKPINDKVNSSINISNKISIEVEPRSNLYPTLNDNQLERVIKKLKRIVHVAIEFLKYYLQ